LKNPLPFGLIGEARAGLIGEAREGEGLRSKGRREGERENREQKHRSYQK
jgi:hypothetical protein